jgi:hypothetical protein
LVAELEVAIAANKDNGAVLRQLKALKETATGLVHDYGNGGQAAKANYAERVAPNFRSGAGGELDQALRRPGDRVRPSETASAFLTRPEDARQLMQIAGLRGNANQTAQAARTWMMDQLSQKGVFSNGGIDPLKLARWRNVNADLLDQIPGLRGQVDQMVTQAQQHASETEQAGALLDTAKGKLAQSQDEINKGALGSIMKADPDQLVHSIMDGNAPKQGMAQVLKAVGKNQAARNGLKAAVRDWLLDRAANNSPGQMLPGDERRPVSIAKLTQLFEDHRAVLAQIYTPEEMNALNAGHKALQLAEGARRQSAGGGSSTTEKALQQESLFNRLRDSALGRGVESFARLHFGAPETGGKIAGIRRALGNVGGKEDMAVHDLLQRAAVDPELMGLLLGRKLPVGSPAWNVRLNQLLAVKQGTQALLQDQAQ